MKVYVVLEEIDYVGDFSEDHGDDYDTSILAIFSNKDDAKKMINSMPEKIEESHHIVSKKVEHNGWLISLKTKDDDMFTDCKCRYRCIEEEVQ